MGWVALLLFCLDGVESFLYLLHLNQSLEHSTCTLFIICRIMKGIDSLNAAFNTIGKGEAYNRKRLPNASVSIPKPVISS